MADDLIASSTTVTNLIRKTQAGDLKWRPVYASSSSEVWSAQDGDSTVILTSGSIIESAESQPPSGHIAIFAGSYGPPTVIIKDPHARKDTRIEYFPAIKNLLSAVKKST